MRRVCLKAGLAKCVVVTLLAVELESAGIDRIEALVAGVPGFIAFFLLLLVDLRADLVFEDVRDVALRLVVIVLVDLADLIEAIVQ